LQSKLSDADALIEKGFALCKSSFSKIASSPNLAERDRLKKEVRAFATYKLTYKLSYVIA
jgi:hypothetical protein